MDLKNLYVQHLQEISKKENISLLEAAIQGGEFFKNHNKLEGGSIFTLLLSIFSLGLIKPESETSKLVLQNPISENPIQSRYLYEDTLLPYSYKYKDNSELAKLELKNPKDIYILLDYYFKSLGYTETQLRKIKNDYEYKNNNLDLEYLESIATKLGFFSIAGYLLYIKYLEIKNQRLALELKEWALKAARTNTAPPPPANWNEPINTTDYYNYAQPFVGPV